MIEREWVISAFCNRPTSELRTGTIASIFISFMCTKRKIGSPALNPFALIAQAFDDDAICRAR